MSHQIARGIIFRNSTLLRRHHSGDPEYELDPDKAQRLQDEIDEAQEHLEDEPNDFEPTYRNKRGAE